MIAVSEVKGVMDPDEAEPEEANPAPLDDELEAANSDSPAVGLIAEFAGPDQLLQAARRVRDAGFRCFDVHAPYPIHGMDAAMGLGRSQLGWIVGGAGLVGVLVAIGLQYYPSVIEYPLITGGKPYDSWPLFVPIIFELGVLFAGFAAVLGMFALTNLPQWYHPTLKHRPFLEATDNKFFLAIEAEDPHYDESETKQLMYEIGGSDIKRLKA
jgi:hypothetical protein